MIFLLFNVMYSWWISFRNFCSASLSVSLGLLTNAMIFKILYSLLITLLITFFFFVLISCGCVTAVSCNVEARLQKEDTHWWTLW